jgi:hypothetical protein
MNHALEVTRLVTILKSPTIPEERKLQAEKRLMDIRYEVTKDEYGIPEDRIEDVMQLEDIINDPRTTQFHKDQAKRSVQKIVHESKDIRSMRKRLIKEMRAGRTENMRDITEYVSKHSKYQ